MRYTLYKFAVATLTASALAQQPGDKPAMTGFNIPASDADLTNELKPHSVTGNTTWTPGTLPQACWNDPFFYEPQLLWADFEVRNIRFSDCDKGSWAICRHKRAQESWDTIANQVSRVPIGMRQNIANILVIPAAKLNGNGITAYSSIIAGVPYQVYSPGYLQVAVMLHETSHGMDSYALRDVVAAAGYPAGTDYSSTTMFQGAWKKDSAVPNDYAKTNWAEDFAEVGRYLALPDLVHPGGLATGKYGNGWKQCANQMGNYEGRLRDLIFPAGGVCTFKVATTPSVTYGSERRIPQPPPPGIIMSPPA